MAIMESYEKAKDHNTCPDQFSNLPRVSFPANPNIPKNWDT